MALWAAPLLSLAALGGTAAAHAPPPPSVGALQEQLPDGTLIRRVEIRGLESISEEYVRRLIRTRESQPLSNRQLQEDVREIFRTRKFANVFAETRTEEGQAVVVFALLEKPEIVSVQIEGNQKFNLSELFELTPATGTPLDLYEVNKARDDILRKYKEAGYYYATVEVDAALLEQERRLLIRISEGPRVRVRHIRYEGNTAFPEARLDTKISTKTYIWVFRTGEFDAERAERDALDLQSFYRDEGFLDARVGFRTEFEKDDRANLTLVFVIDQGVRYRVRDVAFAGQSVFSADDLRAAIKIEPNGFVREEVLREDRRRLSDLYGQIGYVDVVVESSLAFLEEPGLVTVNFQITENNRFKFGRITIRGNEQTKDEVVRRELRFYPGNDYDTVAARKAEQRLRETGLFSEATVKPLDAGEPDARDALVEVREANAINFLIGGGVSSDAGLVGSFTIENRNFDLADTPRTWGEFFRGQSFRGDGQRVRLLIEPGTELTRFRLDFDEPYLLDKPLRFGASAYLFQRERDAYDERRIGGVLSLGRRFESGLLEGWAVEGAARAESIRIDDINDFAAQDIRRDRGSSFLTSLKGAIVRDTTDSRVFPTEGYRLSFSWEQVGALGGDFDFGQPSAGITWYRTLRTDIFDRKSVLALRGDVSYIVDEAPVFERLYAGGFGSIRGFEFRGVSPREGIREDAVGGNFMLLSGAEYSFPLYSKVLRGVTFIDMGTVEEDFELTEWRASVGFGFRVQLDYFGAIPFVFDFGFPIAQDDDDEEQVFNFSVGASFW
ncbi:MAG: Outer membrane protein assembly factor BamA [Phycisphaerae bacterium]|nr:Outer membrane protein assembly factor BamA [Phycisphaerae bacterium]